LARPRVVIIGAGFAGLAAARGLRRAPVDVVVVDRTNHHLFQPLLYQAATATLTPTDISAPVRWLLRRQRNARVLLAEVTDVDPAARQLTLSEPPFTLDFDYLLVATGARHSYFGNDEWERHAPGLKSIDDALEIRRRFLLSLEQAERSEDPAEQEAARTLVIVGAGPTGVELAGIIPDVLRGMRRDFRRLDTRRVRTILVEAGPKVLPTYDDRLGRRAERDLRELGVDVRTGTTVTAVTAEGVQLGDEFIATHTVFWAAGNTASPLGRQLGAPVDRSGRVLVEPDLAIPGYPNIFVAGDLALVTRSGRPIPAVAPVAMQQGRLVARNIRRALEDRPRVPYRFRDKGNLATIGRHKAVAELGPLRIAGRPAWWLWLFVHILYLAGFRNRISVLLQWGYSYFTYQRGARLISRKEQQPQPEPAGAQAVRPRW
jgi:NADH:ubiquinone reductase (H+-translocating)